MGTAMTGLLAVLQGKGSGMAGAGRGRGKRASARILRVGALLGVVLVGALALPRPAVAASVDIGAFTLRTNDGNAALTRGTDYEYGKDSTDIDEGYCLLIKTSTPVTVSMKDGATAPTSDRITVDPGKNKTADVTLDGVKVSYTAMRPYDSGDWGKSPIDIVSGNVALRLAEGSKNELVSVARIVSGSIYYAGAAIHVAHGSSLRIEGSGELNARMQGTDSVTVGSSCMGGNEDETSGAIEIADGRIDLSVSAGVMNAAVMGAGLDGTSSGVTISGGNVSASANATNAHAATIGSGPRSSSCPVRISGGVLNVVSSASAYNDGSAIGGGYMSNSDVTISGGTIRVAYSGQLEASGNPIGAGGGDGQSHKLSITGGKFAEANIQDGTVYGAKVDDGYIVRSNPDGDKATYPYLVTYATGGFKVTGGTLGADYEYGTDGNVEDGYRLLVKTSMPLKIGMAEGVASTPDRITIDPGTGNKADVTLDGVKISYTSTTVTSDFSSDVVGKSPIDIASGDVTLKLTKGSENEIVSLVGVTDFDSNLGALHIRQAGAALHIAEDSSLRIEGSGSLAVRLKETNGIGLKVAGIGGNPDECAGSVEIVGGTVKTSSSWTNSKLEGAIIGAGKDGTCAGVTISGGTVTATADGPNNDAAGIGSGASSTAGKSSCPVRITGGTVSVSSVVTGPNQGAAIGGGFQSNSDVTISGGAVKVERSGKDATGSKIGAGAKGATNNVTIMGGKFADNNASIESNTVYGAKISKGYILQANADSDKSDYPHKVVPANPTGDFVVSGGTPDEDYTYKDHVLTVKTEAALTISMADTADDRIEYHKENGGVASVSGTKSDRIVIDSGANGSAHVTLNDVAIETRSTDSADHGTKADSPITIASGKVVLSLGSEGSESVLVSVGVISESSSICVPAPALRVQQNASLHIEGEGLLTSGQEWSGGSSLGSTIDAACVGGDWHASAGPISVTNGTVRVIVPASGNVYGAAVGSGSGGSCAGVTVSGGSLSILSLSGSSRISGAGIGAGSSSSCPVNITGGRISISCGGGPAISSGTNGTVSITGGVFADTSEGAVANNTVYGVKPADGYLVYANADESTTASYPVAVGKDPKLKLKTDISTAYGAAGLKASDIIESVTLGENATTGAALDELRDISYAYRAASDAENTDWTTDLPSEVGSYDLKVTFGPRVVDGVQYAGVTKTGSLTVKKIGSSVTATVYKGADATSDFTYGDTITVEATVSADDGAASEPPSVQGKAPVAPSQRQMALYYDADGDGVIDAGEPQLSQAVNADADGTYVMAYNSADKKLPVGSNIKLIAKFVGDVNQDDAQASVTVSLARKELTASLAGDASKEYDGTTALPDGHTVAVGLEGVASGDDVSATAVSLAFDGKDAGSKGIMATGVSLTGDAAGYYALKGAGSDGKLAALSGAVTSGISPRMVELVWSDYEGRVFGDGKTVTATVNNAVSGDKVGVTVMGGAETAVGSHTATATGLTGADAANYALPTGDALKCVYTIAQSGSVIENLKTLNGDTETSDFTYGDTVAVTGAVKATGAAAQPEGDEGTASKRRVGRDEQPTNKVALFYGETRLTEWTDLGEDGAFSLSYNTLDGKIKPVDAITLTVKYRGNANQVDAEGSVTISLAKAAMPLTVTADPTALRGGGKVTLTVASSGLPKGADITVTCDDGSIKLTDNKNGTYTVTLPNKNATYTFTVAYAGDDIREPASASVSVTVTRTGGSGGGGGVVVNPSRPVEIAPSEGGVTTVEPKSAKPGEKVAVTAKPDAGREVGSVAVTDSDGKPVEVEPGEDGAWTFSMPRGGATVSVVYIRIYSDVDYGAWYAAAVRFAATKGLMLGYGNTDLFGVGHALTRAELAVILYRNAGEDTGGDLSKAVNTTGMPDVADGVFYTRAANWAVESGVINGYILPDGSRAFGPNDPVTLEQMVAIIGNLTAGEGEVAGADVSILDRYTDKEGISGWARKSVAWATEVGLVNGGVSADGTRYISSTEAVARERAAGVLFNAFEEGILE